MSTKTETHSVKRESSTYKPTIGTRATVITRSSVGSGGHHSGSMKRETSYRSSFGAGYSLVPGKFAEASAVGVNSFRENREKEKHEMQDLNERLANYIEKVRFLEAQNKALLAEIEKLKKAKGVDFDKIKSMYEDELHQARKIIDELAKEKASFDVKIVSIEDQLTNERIEREKECNQKEEYKDKLDRTCDQLGEYEGEISTLRHRVSSLEDEIQKLRDTIKRLQDENMRLRGDLDAETLCHINEANRAQSLEEELAFITSVYEQEIKELQALANRDTSVEMRDYWKGEMGKAMREIQVEYDMRLDLMRADIDAKYSLQMRSLQAGATKDTMEAQYTKEETKRLRDKISDLNAKLAELNARNSELESRNRDMTMQLSEREEEMEIERTKLTSEINKLQYELEEVLRELQVLMDAKLSLELEIAAYSKLLEGEETRLHVRSHVEHAGGYKTTSSEKMEQVVQSSGTHKKPEHDKKGSPKGIQSSESTGRLTVQRTSRGVISIGEMAADGRYCMIENTSSGYRAKNQNLKDWKVKRTISGKESIEYEFDDYTLEPEKQVKVWAKGAAAARGPHDLVADFFTWGVGSATTVLLDDKNAEKATHNQKFLS